MDVDVVPAADELLVSRRSRRSTAGNRMQAAMAEMALDDSMKDAEEDGDYTNDKDEEDIFDEDFESTDSEAEHAAAAEGAVQEEEKRARKGLAFAHAQLFLQTKRAQWEKTADLAHARNKATFDPQAQAAASSPEPKRSVVTEVATGERRPPVHRQSMRKHTVLNTSLTETRLKRSEEKKAAQGPKKPRPEDTVISQTDLIARALDTEEGNIIEHRDYLKLEEEKRRRARVVRPVVQGPLVRWVSRAEEVQTPVYSQLPYSYAYAGGTTASGYAYPPYYQPGVGSSHHPMAQVQPPHVSPTQTTTHSHFPQQSPLYVHYPPPAPIMRTEKVTRNYVVHEEMQQQQPEPSTTGRANIRPALVSKPSWGETMTALFGAHVNWEEVEVYTGKGRPLSRPIPTCPLTGRPAHYLDPRTGVPFADVGAFETLTRVLNHEYAWSSELGAYVRLEAPAKIAA